MIFAPPSVLKLFKPPAAIKPIIERPASRDAVDEETGKRPFSSAMHDKNCADIDMKVPRVDEIVAVNEIDLPQMLSLPP